MLHGRDKDIDALREGIRQQEREAIYRERHEDIMAREWAREPKLLPACLLGVGDKLLAAGSPGTFYVDGEVTGVGTVTSNGRQVRNGHLWVEYTLRSGGRGGSQWKRTQPILCQYRNA